MARKSGATPKACSKAQAEAIQEKKRERIAVLYLRGRTQQEIADDPEVALNVGNVCRHLKAIREEWKSRASEEYGVRLNRELDKLDLVESTAWTEYERSRQDAVRKVAEDNGGKVKKSIVTEGQCGDPRYLGIVMDCVDKRLKILGAYAAVKIAPTTPEGDKPFNPFAAMPIDQLMAMGRHLIQGEDNGESAHPAIAKLEA